MKNCLVSLWLQISKEDVSQPLIICLESATMDLKDLVLASSNQGKIKELQHMLGDLGINIIPQQSLGIEDADETGLTFVENAILKARHAAEQSGLPAIADDSGLEVDYLKGAPGIYSARYAGLGANDQTNLDKLMSALESVPAEQRKARKWSMQYW